MGEEPCEGFAQTGPAQNTPDPNARHFHSHPNRGSGTCHARSAGETGVGCQTVCKRAIREGLKKAG